MPYISYVERAAKNCIRSWCISCLRSPFKIKLSKVAPLIAWKRRASFCQQPPVNTSTSPRTSAFQRQTSSINSLAASCPSATIQNWYILCILSVQCMTITSNVESRHVTVIHAFLAPSSTRSSSVSPCLEVVLLTTPPILSIFWVQLVGPICRSIQ